MHLAYAAPLLQKLIYNPAIPQTKMSLGDWSYPLNILSCIWLFGSSICFLLPTQYPVTAQNMNWLFAVLIALFLIGVLNWFLNAQYYFKGPPRHVFVTASEKLSLLRS